MRVAALYDIHGNLPALEAVLQDLRREDVDQIVVGGDVTLGPMPAETLACLLDLDTPVRFIEGNCVREVLAQMRGAESKALPVQVREVVRWVAQQIQSEHQELLAGWPKTLNLAIPGLGEVLFCHATPRDHNEILANSPVRREAAHTHAFTWDPSALGCRCAVA